MRSTRACAFLAALCALTAGAGTAAAAGQTDYATFFVEFGLSQGDFAGKIDSVKGKCVKERKIVLYRKQGDEKKQLGIDKTNDKGKFKIGVGDDPKNGKYFAQAKSKSIGSGSCRSEKSAKVEVG